MPEEKKEKFTFSDKIKNSKPAGNKSFAKSSSKIGRDGKPKATLFERTRRDAPFFIAALVALLLLPFLYKYSGQASEEQLLTPGNEQTDFDPERYGFDTAMIEDPDGQIAQLAGRDSLSLIKGWGSNQEEDYGRDDMDLDASASYEGSAEGEYAAEKHASSEMDVEDNTTNIYKRRAGRATRAAFRRTKVGALSPAGLRRPGGSRLGINNWGGGLKGAAKKVGPSAPGSAPKPVSLQPLRAAGSRSGFGQGGAAAARKSKDNMGKADAREALRDSYVKPVGPTRTGGLDLFSMGPGGGSGKLGRTINITPGKEPWWWDMMKTRMQKEWEARFKRKWDWINWMDNLARNILGQVANCIITGDSDGDVDNMFGASGESSNEETCCGWTAKKLDPEKLEKVGGSVKKYCDSKVWKAELKAAGANCDRGYKGSISVKGRRGPIAQRLCCFGLCGSAYLSGDLGLNGAGMQCTDMPNYTVIPSGEARKWNIYTYVVARNYFPESLKKTLNLTSLQTKNGPQNLLCAPMDRQHGGTSLNHANMTGGVGYVKAQEEQARQAVIEQIRATTKVPQEQQEIRERTLEIDQESLGDGCVIMVSRGNVLPYEAMKNQIMDLFKQLGSNVTDADAEKAFYQLDLMYVSSFAVKHKLAYAQWFESGHTLKGLLPMPYWEFNNAYVEHRKTTHKKDGSRDNVFKRKFRVEGLDKVEGPVCFYDNLNFECGPEDSATAKLHFDRESFKGGNGEKPSVKDVVVSAEFRYLDNPNRTDVVEQPMIKPDQSGDNGFTFTYTFDRIYDSIKAKRTGDAVPLNVAGEGAGKGGLVGIVRWAAVRGEQRITKECPLNLSGDGETVIVDPKPCAQGPQTSKECCEEIYGSQDSANNYKWEGGKCVITPKPQAQKHTVYAPRISCVPNGVTDRKAVTGNISCDLFGTPLVGKYNTKGQSCKDLWGFKMDSAKATAFVNRVKEAYNAQHKDLPIKFDKTYPQDSEFIDALNIAPTVGISDVPVAAVCELGRDFVRMSKDKHAGDRSIQAGQTGTKQEDLIFRNELGAFLTYIHDTSILYPDAFVRYGGKSECDWRFQPYHVTDGGCNKDLGPKMGKAYAHNNYNGTNKGDKYQRFMSSLTPIMKQAPLKALANGKDLPHRCGNCKSMDGKNYVKQYNSYNGFAGLLHEQDESINGQGVACEAFLGGNKNITMSVADALKYIEGLCTAGLDYKPYGVGAESFNPNQRPTTSGGPGGKDEITSKPIN